MKKSQFKKLVKECLMEILQEGLNESISLPVSLNFSLNERKNPKALQEVIGHPTQSNTLNNHLAAEVGNLRNHLRESLAPDLVEKEKNMHRQTRLNDAFLDTPVANINNRNLHPVSKDVVKETVRSIAPNDIMADIFADTLQTTLVEQENGELIGEVEDNNAAKAAMSDPTELFPESKKWASLAFS